MAADSVSAAADETLSQPVENLRERSVLCGAVAGEQRQLPSGRSVPLIAVIWEIIYS